MRPKKEKKQKGQSRKRPAAEDDDEDDVEEELLEVSSFVLPSVLDRPAQTLVALRPIALQDVPICSH
jgi:hypothetical protein